MGIVEAQGIEGLCRLIQQLEQPSEAIPELMRNTLLVLAPLAFFAAWRERGA